MGWHAIKINYIFWFLDIKDFKLYLIFFFFGVGKNKIVVFAVELKKSTKILFFLSNKN